MNLPARIKLSSKDSPEVKELKEKVNELIDFIQGVPVRLKKNTPTHFKYQGKPVKAGTKKARELRGKLSKIKDADDKNLN